MGIEFDNVLHDSFDPFEIREGNYLGETFLYLKDNFPNFNEYLFLIYSSNTGAIPSSADSPEWMTPSPNMKRVLIWTGAEHKFSQFESIKNKYHHIFSPYNWDRDYVTSIPLGYHAESDYEPHPMNERALNIAFVGCLNRNRLKLACKLAKIPRFFMRFFFYINPAKALDFLNYMCKMLHPKDFYEFTSDFGKGLNINSYISILNSSKISLCPRGWVNAETYRLYESMRAGCITISERLPDRKYYKNIPVFQVDDWSEGLRIAKCILREDEMVSLGRENKQFYEDNLSPAANAKIIMEKLNELRNQQ